MLNALPYLESGTTLLNFKQEQLSEDSLSCNVYLPPSLIVSRWATFYQLTGLGSCLRATAVSGAFDPVISAYGTPCGSLTCIQGNADALVVGGDSSSVEWFGSACETYFVCLATPSLLDMGSYELRIEVGLAGSLAAVHSMVLRGEI